MKEFYNNFLILTLFGFATIQLTNGLKCFDCYWNGNGGPGTQPLCEKNLPESLLRECSGPINPDRQRVCISTFTSGPRSKDIVRSCGTVNIDSYVPGCRDDYIDEEDRRTICFCDYEGCNQDSFEDMESEDLRCYECRWDNYLIGGSNDDCIKRTIPHELSRRCPRPNAGMKSVCTETNFEFEHQGIHGVTRGCGEVNEADQTSGCSPEEIHPDNSKSTTCFCKSNNCNSDNPSKSSINYSSMSSFTFILFAKLYFF